MTDYRFERRIVADVLAGTTRKKKLIHIITGPRQVGKTTASLQIADRWKSEVGELIY
jgi:predicted AAA+ superfamily ATPase